MSGIRRPRRKSAIFRYILRVGFVAAAICAGLFLVRFAVQAIGSRPEPAKASESAAPVPPTEPPKPTAIDLQKVRPNEVGHIPVIMYHDIQASSNYDRLGLNISRERFKRHLQMMKDAGWYPITMREVALGHVDVPLGKTPVVLTFDDGRRTQFRLLANGQIDPNCAVGILEDFAEKNPDFPFKATFYLIGELVPFEQKTTAAWKIGYLIDKGCEIGNHGWTHRYMDQNRGGWVNEASLKKEVAEAVRRIRAYDPRATLDTYCIPGGGYPRNKSLWKALREGSHGGTTYRNLALLNAWGGPSRSPFSTGYDPMKVDRIGVGPGNFEEQFAILTKSKNIVRYVSDGDPDAITVPRQYVKYVLKSALAKRILRVYDPEPTPEPATQASHKP